MGRRFEQQPSHLDQHFAYVIFRRIGGYFVTIELFSFIEKQNEI